MAQHARATSGAPRLSTALASFAGWHDARPRASLGSIRGFVWVALICAVFFWMSNPLVFVPGFHLSLEKSVLWTALALVATLPWARIPRVPWPWIVFHVLTAMSLAWTIDPHLTHYTLVLYLKITLVALVIAAACEPAVVCWGMGLGGVVVVVLSIYSYNEQMWGTVNVFYGGIAGVGANENILAYTLNISLAAILAARPTRHLALLGLWAAVVAVNGYGIYLADSGTGFLTALTVLLAMVVMVARPGLHNLGRRHVLMGSGAIVGVLVGGTLLIVSVLGKEIASLSGRAPFWQAAWESTMDTSPILGSGWGAVWTHPWSMVPPNKVAQDIYDRAGYTLPHGHNLFVDVLPELGLLGVALAVVMLYHAAREGIRSGIDGAASDPVAGRLVLLSLVALVMSGITEPMFTVPLGWWLLALIAALPRQRFARARQENGDVPERADLPLLTPETTARAAP